MRAVRLLVGLGRSNLKNIRGLTTTSCNFIPHNIVKSQFPDIQIPKITLDEFLLRNVDRWSDKIAAECAETGRNYTYGQIQKDSERLAQALWAKLGFKKGDVIAIMLPNVPEFLTALIGCFSAGIIVTTINPIYTADEITRQIKSCNAKAIITLSQSFSVVETAIRNLQTNTKFPIITIKHNSTDVTPTGAINFSELCEYNGPQVKIDKSHPEDLVLLPYSSGTSGLPKGVQLLHRNIVCDLSLLQHEWVKLNAETTGSHQDVVPIVAPLYHCYGMVPVAFNMFSEGCKCVTLPKYTPDKYLTMLEKYPGNVMHIVPPILLMLCTHERARREHLERVRHVKCAAAPLASSDIERFLDKYGHHIKLLQAYGLTETGPVTHMQRLDKPITPGAAGWNLSLTECRIVSVDDENKNLGPNETGHLLIRGPQIMPGYHDNPKATQETIDSDGWLRTGDIAHYDDDGQFFITDRIKELIKVKGFQVAPAELEALLREHPDVEEAAVTGVKHPQHGEAPKAFVVPRKGSNLTPENVQLYVKEKAAKYKQLTGGVVFVEDIPKNPSGKILRRNLKDM